MQRVKRLGAAVAAAAFLALAGSASALAAGKPVFVQTDNVEHNQIVAYDRADDGSLSQVGTYDTGGLGGKLEGSVVDHLASQGSLTYDRANGLLYAVNAGSDTVSVFAVFGDRLALRQVTSSGGSFPVSVAVHDGLVYVVNAEGGGFLQGYRVLGGRLSPIPGSGRELGLNPEATPQFVNTPGQVIFSPDGTQLIVTTKANGNAVDIFGVNTLGLLTRSPVVNSLPGAVPFAATFDRQGNLLLTEAGPDALVSFQLLGDGTIAQLDSALTGQGATCWVVAAVGRFYASNAGSGSLSAFKQEAGGQLLSLFETASTEPGTVDAATPVSGGRFLYVQTGLNGTVDEFSIGAGGALSPIGFVAVPGAIGGEGIVAL